jgi:hypothetical protein
MDKHHVALMPKKSRVKKRPAEAGRVAARE